MTYMPPSMRSSRDTGLIVLLKTTAGLTMLNVGAVLAGVLLWAVTAALSGQ